jgi:hypothetical protein
VSELILALNPCDRKMVIPADVRAQYQVEKRAPQDGEGEHVSILF